MVELFRHIIDLDFQWLFSNYNDAVYIILFLVIFIETGLVIMPFLPGDSLLFFAGLFARAGYLDFMVLCTSLFVAAVLGDNINYWIGRKVGLRVFQINFRGKPLVKKEYLERTEIFFQKYGTKAIIMARFVPFVRTFAPFAAGVGQMDYRKYLAFDILGGVLWIGGLLSAGYLLGEIDFIKKHVDLVCLGIVGLSILPIIIQFAKARLSRKS